jgi:alkylated DNA nucleotide flippase Atl1
LASNSNLESLWTLVKTIPSGMCTSYGRLGQALPRPVSGFLVGRWMAQAPEGIPWWRVVGKDGDLLIDKIHPEMGNEQKRLLEAEGVPFAGDQVIMRLCLYDVL